MSTKKASEKTKTKKAAPKKVAVPKTKKAKAPGISDHLRKIMTPKSGTVCAVTYGEANASVKKAFPTRKKLYQSEFDRNFDKLVAEGVLKTKKPAEFKIKKEKPAPAKKKAAPKKKSASKKKATEKPAVEAGATNSGTEEAVVTQA